MTDKKTYTLSCHCQKNVATFTAPVPPTIPDHGHVLKEGEVCNCAFCIKKLPVWYFLPREDFSIIRGCTVEHGSMTKYLFASRTLENYFCNDCGTLVYSIDTKQPEKVVVNLRAIRDPDFEYRTLPLAQYDGAKFGSPVVPAEPPAGAKEYLEKRAQHYDFPTEIFTGECHCGAVKYSTLLKPLPDEHLVACLCSICHGNGAIWAYPGTGDIYFDSSKPNPMTDESDSFPVKRYTFGRGINGHYFCKTCGVNVFEFRLTKPDKTGFQGWREQSDDDNSLGVNVAIFNGMAEYLADGRGAMLKNLKWDDTDKYEGGVYEVKV